MKLLCKSFTLQDTPHRIQTRYPFQVYALPFDEMLDNVSGVCSTSPTIEPYTPDRILYNRVPKCGSTTISRILHLSGVLNDHQIKLQVVHNGMLMNITQQVK